MDEREQLDQDHIEDLELAQDEESTHKDLDGVTGRDTANKAQGAGQAASATDAYLRQ
jgi:hypothetical protein